MRLLRHIKSPIVCLAFAPDGKTLAATSWGRMQIGLWQLPGGKFRRWHPYADTWVCSLAYSPDGKWLAVGNDWGMVLPYECASQSYDSECHAEGSVHGLAFAPNRPLLAVAAGGVSLWALDEGPWGLALDPARNLFSSVAFSPDGRAVAAGNLDHLDVSLWQLDGVLKKRPRRTRIPLPYVPVSVAFAPDGKTLAIAAGHTLHLYDLQAGRTRATLRPPAGRILQLAYHPDGPLLATAGSDGSVRFWDTEGNREVQAFNWGIGSVRCVAFAPDGMTCAAGGSTGQVALWDVGA
jgi:WD40 repeat protein